MPQFYVYVLHTDRKLADHAQHYVGATSDLLSRLVRHAKGNGARITAAFKEQGISWHVASVFVMSHKSAFNCERRVKKQKNTCRFCGTCCDDGPKSIQGATALDLSLLGIPLTSAELAAVELPSL